MELIDIILDNVKIEDIMSTNILKVCTTHNTFKAINLMRQLGKSALVIIDYSNDNSLKEYILTSQDIIDIIYEKISFKDFLRKKPNEKYEKINIDDSICIIIDLIKNGYNKLIPVYSNNRIKGIIFPEDILTFMNSLLFKTQKLFNNILDSIHDALCIVDKNANVIVWNKSAENLYKVDKEKILNRKIQQIFPSALLPKVLAEGNSYENVFNSPREGCYNIISAKPLKNDDQIIGAISCDKDISELIHISELLNKTQSNLQVLEKEVSNINENRFAFSQIISNDDKFKEIIEFSKNISKSKLNVLITGESGTGKEVFARAIHVESGRKGYFVPINCSAIPSELMESELFGYKGGAFTGSSKEGRIGKFELANNGTIFLDEIGDMPLNMQPKILRVIEDGIITRIGSETSIKVDVRIIAATNKDLKKLMENGLFRKDLYYRLNSVLIELPPLRERKSDIPLLVNKFLKDFCIAYGTNIIKLPSEVMDMLLNHDWEGNVRELKNLIEQIVILSKHGKFDISHLPSDIVKKGKKSYFQAQENNIDLSKVISSKEKELIINALKICNNNKLKAAKMLNIPRSTLYFKMNKYGIQI